MTAKPPSARHRFRRRPQAETLSARDPNPVQPDAKPPPAREGKRIKRNKPVDGRPLGAATSTSLNGTEHQPVYTLAEDQHAHVIDDNGVCLRCNEPSAPGLSRQPVVALLTRKENLELPDGAATRELADGERVRLYEWAYANRLRLWGRIARVKVHEM